MYLRCSREEEFGWAWEAGWDMWVPKGIGLVPGRGHWEAGEHRHIQGTGLG